VLDVLVKAGGPTSDADLSKAVLVRQDEKGQPVVRPLDLKKIIATGSRAANELLRPGDVLFVPDKKAHKSAADSLNLLWPLTGLINLLH
jgi:protein involved in polysaccharide export with SLBB domain